MRTTHFCGKRGRVLRGIGIKESGVGYPGGKVCGDRLGYLEVEYPGAILPIMYMGPEIP